MLSALLALSHAECPATDPMCHCSVKVLGLHMSHYITCSELGTRSQLPYFGVASQPTEELRVRSGSTVTTVQSDAFSGLRLRVAKLSSIGLQSVSPTAFRGADERLEEIYLGDNALRQLDEATFSGLRHLRYLGLQGNGLNGIERRLFAALTNLGYLHLSNNALRTLPENAFSSCSALRGLHLQDNLLTSLPQGTFYELTNLWQLDLAGNRLQDIPDDAFKHLTSLERLQLADNELSEIKHGLFKALAHLEHLDLAANSLSDIPDDVFQGCSSLTFLSIANNRLTIIRPGMIDVLLQLRTLHLQVSATFMSVCISHCI